MRQIKFRAFHKGKMITSASRIMLSGGRWLVSEQKSDEYEPLEGELMQFTGLHDKNGIEIYEGDIVKYTRINGKEIIAEIEWRREDGCYYYFNHKEPVDSDVSNKESTFFIATTITEIIGNIYENPDLIR